MWLLSFSLDFIVCSVSRGLHSPKMTVCCFRDCKNRILKQVSKSVKFFALSSERLKCSKEMNVQLFKRRCAWLKNANQKYLDDYVTPRFCSEHFHTDNFILSVQSQCEQIIKIIYSCHWKSLTKDCALSCVHCVLMSDAPYL